MNTIAKQIDWSVNHSRKDTKMRNTTHIIPTIPVSTAEVLKSVLVKELSAEYTSVEAGRVHQAVNEAHALAALTNEPLLFLPALAEEKVQNAAAWSARQRSLLQTDSLALAA
jgi:hypothetical protein